MFKPSIWVVACAAGAAFTPTASIAQEAADPLDEVVVTGTRIRGEAAVGSQLITVDRESIERQGFQTAQDIVRAMPQNFGGGASEDTTGGQNASSGTALNLRGLGPSSTLVLINGRRLPASGGRGGNFTDVSSIPVAAIERVEVLPDGASAVYGADAIGGVVNYVLRRDFEGAETQARWGMSEGGNAEEKRFAQLFGVHWNGGRALLSYEFRDRENLSASERRATRDSDLTALGGSNFSNISSNPGTIRSGTQRWAVPTGQDGTLLTAADFVPGTVNYQNTNEGGQVVGSQRTQGLYVMAEHSFGPRVTAFMDVMATERDAENRSTGFFTSITIPNTNPFYVNPMGGTAPVTMSYSFHDDLGSRGTSIDVETISIGPGVKVALPGDWEVTAQAALGRERVKQLQTNSVNTAALTAALADPNPATAFNAFGDGSFTNPATLDALRASATFDTESELASLGVVADGELWSLPGGAVSLALGADVREQTFKSVSGSSGTTTGATDFRRQVLAYFGEVLVPILGNDFSLAGAQELVLSIAARRDDYDDFGAATTPRVGLLWSPVNGVRVRGSWGESFRAPGLADLDESNNASFIISVSDPRSPNGFSDMLVWSGNNADLTEERSVTRSIGIDLELSELAGTRFSVTWFDIEFEDRIQSPTPLPRSVNDPQYSSRITLDPDADLRERICSSSQFAGVAGACQAAPLGSALDFRTGNTAVTQTSGVDFVGTWRATVGLNEWGADLNASYLFDFAEAQRAGAPLIELVSIARRPIDFRGRAGASWGRGPISAQIYANYLDNSRDVTSTPRRRVGSWTTWDVHARYALSESGLGKGLTASLHVQNVFNRDPPFFNNPEGVGYDRDNADLFGRTTSVQVSKSW